jgi:hypothetical protein
MDPASTSPPSAIVPTRQTAFDYDRTVVAFHGTKKVAAQNLVDGVPFGPSQNDDDWLGHGIYFWEYAPQQAWSWAKQRHGKNAAVVGALVRLGRCVDLLDPSNANLLEAAHEELAANVKLTANATLTANAHNHKYLDCAVFNYLFARLALSGYGVESTRAVFVPLKGGKGLPRLWRASGVFHGAHIQISVREPNNILAVWPVREDGRYGKAE